MFVIECFSASGMQRDVDGLRAGRGHVTKQEQPIFFYCLRTKFTDPRPESLKVGCVHPEIGDMCYGNRKSFPLYE